LAKRRQNPFFFPNREFLFYFGNSGFSSDRFSLPANAIFAEKKVAKRKKNVVYEKVRIEDIGSEGKSLARINDMVVFTKLVVPGDVVDLRVIRKRKRYQEAIVTAIHEYSSDRSDAFCSHFGICGGCKWQILPYEKQLYYKQQQVVDQLKRIGKAELPDILPIRGSQSDTFYRNKLEFTFSAKRWLSHEEMAGNEPTGSSNALGFHVPGMFDKVIQIDKCWLQPAPSNEIRNFIYQYALDHQLSFFDIKQKTGFLRTLIIRTNERGEAMVVLSFFYDAPMEREALLKALRDRFPEITSLMYVINSKGNDTITDQEIMLFHGESYLYEAMEDLRFKIGPKSFFQTNTRQAYELYRVALQFAGLTGDEIVYDLYTGTGTIANFVARNARKVVGIEYVPEAIDDARINASINGIENATFYAGDIKEILNESFIQKEGQPDVIITDPPRAGMHSDVINTMLSLAPKRIVYVSCNPATQARDIQLLSSGYRVTNVQPVDMFPHTHHVENVVLLEREEAVTLS
jgi:23S rRNA (uracil1939-C5)-methyltransferase